MNYAYIPTSKAKEIAQCLSALKIKEIRLYGSDGEVVVTSEYNGCPGGIDYICRIGSAGGVTGYIDITLKDFKGLIGDGNMTCVELACPEPFQVPEDSKSVGDSFSLFIPKEAEKVLFSVSKHPPHGSIAFVNARKDDNDHLILESTSGPCMTIFNTGLKLDKSFRGFLIPPVVLSLNLGKEISVSNCKNEDLYAIHSEKGCFVVRNTHNQFPLLENLFPSHLDHSFQIDSKPKKNLFKNASFFGQNDWNKAIKLVIEDGNPHVLDANGSRYTFNFSGVQSDSNVTVVVNSGFLSDALWGLEYPATIGITRTRYSGNMLLIVLQDRKTRICIGEIRLKEEG